MKGLSRLSAYRFRRWSHGNSKIYMSCKKEDKQLYPIPSMGNKGSGMLQSGIRVIQVQNWTGWASSRTSDNEKKMEKIIWTN